MGSKITIIGAGSVGSTIAHIITEAICIRTRHDRYP